MIPSVGWWRVSRESTYRETPPLSSRTYQAAGLEVGLGTADDFNKLVDTFTKLSPAGVKVLKDLIGQGS